MHAKVYPPGSDLKLDSPTTLHQPICTYQPTTPSPPFYSHLKPEMGDISEDDDGMYGQQSYKSRHGAGGRGRYLASPANSMGARKASLPIVKPPTASHSPPAGAMTCRGQGQAPPRSPRHFNPRVITPPTMQTPQYKPVTSGYAQKNWAHHQEFKIKVLGLPRGCWTQTVYEVLSKHGKIVRIEMQLGSMDCNAWVTFQYVLPLHLETLC
jgi:hypothetical protein